LVNGSLIYYDYFLKDILRVLGRIGTMGQVAFCGADLVVLTPNA
jgi:hypothetical protein